MGKAQVLGGGEDGLYTIRRQYDEILFSAMVVNLNEKITGLDQAISALNESLVELRSARDAASAALDAAVAQYVVASAGGTVPQAELDAYKTAAENAAKAAGNLRAVEWQVAVLRADRAGAQKRLDMITAAQAPASEPAWCADLTESASGEVATVEINGEPSQALVILPQQQTWSPYSPENDGILMPREWMSPEQAFFNAAILPGWQRHKPIYRAGTITAIDYDANTCDLTLAPATSTAQGLNINHVTALSAVPVQYMTCDTAAFEVGDVALVAFVGQRWDQPMVIGFVSNPKECPASRGYVVLPADNTAPSGWMTDEHGDPAPPSAYVHLQKEGAVPPEVRLHQGMQAGNISWRGAKGRLLSYEHGQSSRYGVAAYSSSTPGTDQLYMYGTRLTAPGKEILGAGIFAGHVIIADRVSSTEVEFHSAPSPETELRGSLDEPDSVIAEKTMTWTSLGTVSASDGYVFRKPWFFHPEGTECQTVTTPSSATGGNAIRTKVYFAIDPDTSAVELSSHDHIAYGHPRLAVNVQTIAPGDPLPPEFIGHEVGPWIVGRDDSVGYDLLTPMLGPGMTIDEVTPAGHPDTYDMSVHYDWWPSAPWAFRFTKGFVLLDSGGDVYAWAQGGWEVRKAWSVFRIVQPRDSVRFYANDGRDLVAVDYSSSGEELFVELMAAPGGNEVTWVFENVNEVVYSARLPEFIWNVGEAYRGLEPHASMPGGAPQPNERTDGFNPGHQFWIRKEESVHRMAGSLSIQLTVNGVAVASTSINAASVIESTGSIWGLDVELDEQDLLSLVATPATAPAPVYTPLSAVGMSVIDIDARERAATVVNKFFTLDIVDVNYSSPSYPTICSLGLRTESTSVIYDSGVVMSTDDGTPAQFSTRFDGVSYQTGFNTAYYFLRSVLSETLVTASHPDFFAGADVSRMYLRHNDAALGTFACRDRSSMVASIPSRETVPQYSIYARFGNAEYGLATDFDVPSKINFRLNPIRAV